MHVSVKGGKAKVQCSFEAVIRPYQVDILLQGSGRVSFSGIRVKNENHVIFTVPPFPPNLGRIWYSFMLRQLFCKSTGSQIGLYLSHVMFIFIFMPACRVTSWSWNSPATSN